MKSCVTKRVFAVFVLAAVTGLAAWGQGTLTYPDPAKLELQAAPQSIVNYSSGGLFSAAIDDYASVTYWQDVEIEKGYFFLGGKASPSQANGLIGGYAANLGGNRLGIFYNGTLLSGSGNSNGAEEADDKTTDGEATWNNSLALLFGSEAIGGIRLDILLQNAKSVTSDKGEKAGDSKSITNTGAGITTLQWGKAIGDLRPSVAIGFQWPEYTKTTNVAGDEDATTETWKNTAVGAKLALDYKAFSADYQFTANFGDKLKAKDLEGTTNGYIDNRLNVSYTLEGTVGDKLTLKARPGLSLGLYGKDYGYKGSVGDQSFEGHGTIDWNNLATGPTPAQPETYFQLQPKFAAGAKYAVNEKWNLYTGLEVDVLTWNVKGTSPYKPTTEPTEADEIKTTPSQWSIAALTGVSPNLGFELHPSDNFSVEFGFNSYLSDSYANWTLNLMSMGGGLAVNVKF